MLLRGQPIADRIKKDIVNVIKKRETDGSAIPKVALLRVGKRPDDISYEAKIIKDCQSVGILTEVTELDYNVSMLEFMKVFMDLNTNPEVHGILLFRPLPSQLDMSQIGNAIRPEKDIDCMSPINMAKIFVGDKSAMTPCTSEAAVEMLKYYYEDLSGKNIVIVNRSLVLGKPLAMLLLEEDATVTICHSKTKNLADITSQADIIVTGVGSGRFFGPEYFSRKSIVVDAGVNFIQGKICGDVDFDAVEPMVSAITPLPGGLGTVTSMLLLRNVIKGVELLEG